MNAWEYTRKEGGRLGAERGFRQPQGVHVGHVEESGTATVRRGECQAHPGQDLHGVRLPAVDGRRGDVSGERREDGPRDVSGPCAFPPRLRRGRAPSQLQVAHERLDIGTFLGELHEAAAVGRRVEDDCSEEVVPHSREPGTTYEGASSESRVVVMERAYDFVMDLPRDLHAGGRRGERGIHGGGGGEAVKACTGGLCGVEELPKVEAQDFVVHTFRGVAP